MLSTSKNRDEAAQHRPACPFRQKKPPRRNLALKI